MATFQTIDPSQVDALSPINELLMLGNSSIETGGIKYDLDALNDRVTILEQGGGGGGGGGSASSGEIGVITQGGETNEGRYWKRRFSPFQHMLKGDPNNQSGFDPEGTNLDNELFQYIESNDTGLSTTTNDFDYLGARLNVSKGEKIAYRLKKGINFFSVGFTYGSGGSDAVKILINGETPSSLGLTDENGNLQADSFNTNSGTTANGKYQVTSFFYGLNGKENVIEIFNDDSATKQCFPTFLEIGYRSNDYALDNKLQLKAGKATARGAETVFPEQELEFGKTELNGHTGAIVLDKAGNITALDGESPAMTQTKPLEEIDFASPVASLPVKNNFYFPDSGICILSMPYGNHHAFSYASKTDALIQAHSLNGLRWQSQPVEPFTPSDNLEGGNFEGTGEININYWGTAPILINSTNNKLDFTVTIAGVTTTHTATIPVGRYAANVVSLGSEIEKQMETNKPINGEYKVSYNPISQLWSLSVNDEAISELNLLFTTGANAGNSIADTLGFSDADLTGSKSYLASTAKQHLCCKALEASKEFSSPNGPKVKTTTTPQSNADPDLLDVVERLGFADYLYINSNGYAVTLFPDDDCCGIETAFMTKVTMSLISYSIDNGPIMTLTQAGQSQGQATRGKLISNFISFPRGSRRINFYTESANNFKLSTTASALFFLGFREYFTKPAYEKLTLDQSIIKTYDIAPISLYATEYGHNGGNLYSPNNGGGAATDDQVNIITESGSWSSAAFSSFNGFFRNTSSSGAYQEFNFTIEKDGGGFYIKQITAGGNARALSVFISESSIDENTDLVQLNRSEYDPYSGSGNAFLGNIEWFGTLGLKAGTYNIRFKKDSLGQGLLLTGFTIIDGKSPQENANTNLDLNNDGQGVSFPINTIKAPLLRDSGDRVPGYLERSGYKEGITSGVNYFFSSGVTLGNFEDELVVTTGVEGSYYSNQALAKITGDGASFSALCKSVTIVTNAFTGDVLNSQPSIDGVTTTSLVNNRQQVKNGSSPSSNRSSSYSAMTKEFNLSCSFSSGNTFLVSDTRGIKIGAKVLLDDGTNKEIAFIDSIVVATSFTVKSARSVVIDADIERIHFQGFHNVSIEQTANGNFRMSDFRYEPLTIKPSKALIRHDVETVTEVASVAFYNLPANADLYYPVHSDGVPGNRATSFIEITGNENINGSWNFKNFGLKNAGFTANFISVTIKSTKEVLKNKSKEIF